MTHTFAILEVSAAAYDEIAAKLRAANYDHCFTEYGEPHCDIDMHGIGLKREQQQMVAGVVLPPIDLSDRVQNILDAIETMSGSELARLIAALKEKFEV